MTLLEFCANFIARVLTLKVIETDTLYLVFKDRFQIVLDCLTDDSNSPQANGDINQPILTCQAAITVLRLLFLENKKHRALLAKFFGEKRHLSYASV
jgi:hypothetical protein